MIINVSTNPLMFVLLTDSRKLNIRMKIVLFDFIFVIIKKTIKFLTITFFSSDVNGYGSRAAESQFSCIISKKKTNL